MRIGVDVGGTKIEAAALDAAGTIVARERRPAPPTYDALVATVVDVVTAVEARAGGRGAVGIGHPGALSPTTGLVKNAPNSPIGGRPLDRDLAAALGRPVRLANDARCFALSEAKDGAGAGAPVVFGVILGTGVGGGLVVDGALVAGASASAGEWGHNPLPWPTDDEQGGPPCGCGRRGCVEAWLSGPALARDHARTTGESLEARAIAARARVGDAAATATLARHADRLARALAALVNVLDPHVIVLGGGLSNLDGLVEGVRARWAAWVFGGEIAARLAVARHGDASGVRGAAWLWPDASRGD